MFAMGIFMIIQIIVNYDRLQDSLDSVIPLIFVAVFGGVFFMATGLEEHKKREDENG